MANPDPTPIVQKFEEFFSDSDLYQKRFADLKSNYPDKRSFIFSYQDLHKYDSDFAEKMIDNPDLFLMAAQMALISMAGEERKGKFEPHIRLEEAELDEKGLLIQNIGSEHIHRLVRVDGVVTKRAEIRPRVKIAVYLCHNCDTIHKIPIEKGTFIPEVCDNCKKRSLDLDEKSSYFVNIQRAEVQELLERVRSGSPASHIEMILDDDLCNSIVPGDTIEVIGIVRLKSIAKTKEPIFSKYIDVINVKNIQREFEEVEISKEEEKQIQEFAKKPDAFEVLVNSVAPSIYGHRETKEAVVLQLFGGNPDKVLPEGGRIRAEIHLLLIGDPGAAKCLTGDSSIVLSDGSIKCIRDIVEDGLSTSSIAADDGYYSTLKNNLMSMDCAGKVGQSEAAVVWKLKAPEYLYRVTTASGKQITTTGIHPFFVPTGGFVGSITAEELKAGNFIATPRVLRIVGRRQRFPIDAVKKGKTNANKIIIPTYVDERFAELAGYLIGDGYPRKTDTSYEVSITSADRRLTDRFVELMNELFGLRCTVRKDRGLDVATVCSIELGRLFEEIGMIRNSWTKTVPVEIQRSENRVVRAFLSAYFDCEGSVRKERGSITLTSASRELVEQVRILLLRFGILSQLHHTTGHAMNTKKKIRRIYNRLTISSDNARKFFEEIGFGLSRKQALRTELKTNTNIDVIPGVASALKDLRRKLGIHQCQCGVSRSAYLHLELGDRHPSRGTLQQVVCGMRKFNGHGETSEILDRLDVLAKSDLFWDRVVSVEKIKSTEKWVYDFEVPGKFNFVANGVIAHNTRMLQYVTMLAPKSIYVSGKSVTGVGLTASAERDDLGEGWTLKAGALVLASGGLAGIDEFDKIDEIEQAALHEVMESGTVSVAKAGIVARFRARTAILAAANPKFGRFDPNQLPAEQFDIPPTLQSRFDLIFPIRDIMDEEKDRKLAQYLIATHKNAAEGIIPPRTVPQVETDFLRKYIAYSRKNIKPVLSTEAAKEIEKYYVELRDFGKRQGVVPITPRQIEGLIRMSEASAKSRLCNIVELRDAQLAIKLVNFVLMEVALDRTTGKIDIDIISTGQPRSRAEQYYDLVGMIRDLLKHHDAVPREMIFEEAKKQLKMDEGVLHRFLDEMQRKGELFEPKPGFLKFVQKYD